MRQTIAAIISSLIMGAGFMFMVYTASRADQNLISNMVLIRDGLIGLAIMGSGLVAGWIGGGYA